MNKEKAYLLTTHTVHESKEMHFYGKGENCPIKVIVDNMPPVFFVEKNASIPSSSSFSRKNLNLKTFGNIPVDGLYFNSHSDLQKMRDFLTKNAIRTYEADVRSTDRYLMERFINCGFEVIGEYQVIDGVRVYKNPKIQKTNFFPNFKLVSLDIETGVDGSLYSIGLHFFDLKNSEEKKIVLMVGTISDTEEVKFFVNERNLLVRFLEVLKEEDPDLIIGWHVIAFDITFLDKLFRKYKVDFLLGRSKRPVQVFERGGSAYLSLDGRVVIDGIVALRSAFYKFENFKLDTVAEELLGKNKDISSDGNKVFEIERRFREDKIALAKYNILDCILVSDIFKKVRLIEHLYHRTVISGMLLENLSMSTRTFDHFFLPKIHREGFVAPNIMDIEMGERGSGGHVFEPVSGIHEHVIVLDFKSLYPSIIRTFNIDPLSRMIASDENVDIKAILNTPVGVNFHKEQHILPDFLESLFEKREEAKRNNDKDLSLAIKILMNSFYGVMGSPRCRFYHADLSASITGTGRWILEKTKNYVESLGLEVIYGDTDSIFVKLKTLDVEKSYEKALSLTVEINNYFDELIYKTFHQKSFLTIEFEKYYKKFFLPFSRSGESGAKKRYAGLLVHENHFEEIIFSGLEVVRQDWTKLARNFQKKLFEKFFHGENFEDWIKEFVDDLKSGKFDEDLVYKKRISKELSEYKKNIPPHIKAAKMIDTSSHFYRLKEVSYVVTRSGPVPIELSPDSFDYQHYVDKQIAPLADMILILNDKKFDDLVQGEQLSLF